MSRDGSGTYNLPAVAIVPAHSLTNSSNFNTTITDIAAALTQSLSKDGQTVPTTNLAMGGNKLVNVGPATSRTEYARADQVQDSTMTWGGYNTGNAVALRISPVPAISAYIEGQRFSFIVLTACTGTATLSVNGLPETPIVFPRWSASNIVEVMYVGGGYFHQVGGSSSSFRDIPAGANIIFYQAAAPTGWTQQTYADDHLLRIVSSTGGGNGGSWVINGLSTENVTHTHNVVNAISGDGAAQTFSAGGSGTIVSRNIHTHTINATTDGQSTPHSHTFNGLWRPAYINVISCTRDAD